MAPANKIEIVASFPPDGCDDKGGKAFPQMRLSALIFWPLARIITQKDQGQVQHGTVVRRNALRAWL